MGGLKSLAKDTVIYGGSTILVKMINYLLTTFLTYMLVPAEFGMMTNLYAYVAFSMVIITFGMETGFFRFANQKDKYEPLTVYSTTLTTVGVIALTFLLVFQIFLPSLRFLWNDDIPNIYIRMILIFLSLDAFCAIPYAYLRYKQRPLKFALLRGIYIAVYTLACVFFLWLCPLLSKHFPDSVNWFYDPTFKVGYILISNLIATFVETCCLQVELFGFKYKFDWALLKKIVNYSFPLVILGLAGMSNQVIDKIIFPFIYPDQDRAFAEFGIYSACFKITMIIMIYTQAFRYAFEPFIFAKNTNTDNRKSYADASKYFIILGLMVFLGVFMYLDVFKYIVAPAYWAGLIIVPIVMMGELFFGVYYNLSLWYKLTDQTYWGAILSIIGCIIIVLINVYFIPVYGYMACAWASFIGNGIIMVLSYALGQKKHPIPYDLKTVGLYFGLALVLYLAAVLLPVENKWLRWVYHSFLMFIYIAVMIKRDLPLKEIPYLNKLLKR